MIIMLGIMVVKAIINFLEDLVKWLFGAAIIGVVLTIVLVFGHTLL